MPDEIQQSDESPRSGAGRPPTAHDRLRHATPLPRAPKTLPDHPLRIALLDLLAEVGTLTSTQAAVRLGESSGLCSFHLRQLARHGLIEEAPHKGGRARPWRLRWESDEVPALAQDTPLQAVVHLTPQESAELTAAVRALLTPFQNRTPSPATTPTTVSIDPHALPQESQVRPG